MPNSYINYLKTSIPLTKKEEKELFKKAKAGDRTAFESIIAANIRFVISIAKNYTGRNIDLEDLVAEGNIGLLKAYERFDHTKNYKFITYAVWWIRQSILQALQDYGSLIRIPANQKKDYVKAIKTTQELEQKYGKSIDVNDVNQYLDEDLENIEYSVKIVSLDEPIEDNLTLSGVIPAETHQDIINSVDESLYEILTEFIDNFPEHEKEILYKYYGIGYDYPYTLEKIGEELGLTRERIRQIKQEIINKLKRSSKLENLKNNLG